MSTLLYPWYLLSCRFIVYLPWTPTCCILFLLQRPLKASEGQRPQTVAIECFFLVSAFANHKRYAGQCHRTWAAWSDACLLEWMYLEYSQIYSKASKDLQVLFGCIVTLVFGFLRSLGEGCCFIACVPQYYGTSVIYTRQSQEKVLLGIQIFFSCFMNSLQPYYMSVFIPKNAGRGTKTIHQMHSWIIYVNTCSFQFSRSSLMFENKVVHSTAPW